MLIKSVRVGIILFIVLLVFFKVYNLNKTDYSVDILKKQLMPLQQYIRPGSKISFYADTEYNRLYIPTQYLLAPHIFSNNPQADSMILIQHKSKNIPLLTIDHYQVIKQTVINQRAISLITKIK